MKCSTKRIIGAAAGLVLAATVSQGYGDVGRDVIAEAHRPSADATGIAAAGGTATLPLQLPYRWTAKPGDDCEAGITLAWTGVLSPSLVSITASITVLDGQGNILRTRPVGEFTATTLAQLLCGNTAADQPACIRFPFPTRPEDGQTYVIGDQEHEVLNIIVTNGDTAPIDMSAHVDAMPAEPANEGCTCRDDAGNPDPTGRSCG